MPRWVDDTEDLDVITPDGTELVRVAKNGASKAVPISALADADLAAHVAASDPHAQYLKEATARDELGLDTNDDVTFKSVTVDDAAYDATTWNGSTAVPTRNAVRDKFASLAQADIAGLTTADSPQFTAVNIGHATDTTLARVGAGRVSIEGREIAYKTVFNIKSPEFGAVGDGTTNDTAAIAAAVTAASAVAGVVYFPDGTYLITSQITVASAGVVMMGASRWGSTIKNGTLDDKCISITANYCSVRDLAFVYNGTPLAGAVAVHVTGSHCHIDNITIRSSEIGVFFSGSGSVSGILTRAKILDYETNALRVQSTNDIYVDDFIFNAGNSTRGSLGGIRLIDKVEAFVATNGDVLNGAYSLTTAASIDSIGTRPAYNFFSNVYFDSAANQCALLQNFYENSFVSCWFSGGRTSSGFSGMDLVSGSSNFFGFCKFFNCGSHGARVRAGATKTFFGYSSFESNSVTAGSGVSDGISIDANTAGVTISNCKASNGLHPGVQRYGIAIGSGATYINVVLNDVRDNGTGGVIYSATSTTNRVYDNNGSSLHIHSPQQWYELASSNVAVTYTGGTSEQTLATVTVPAGSMGANGRIRIFSLWSFTSSANSKTTRVRFNGASGTIYESAGHTNMASWRAYAEIGNRNSASSQIGGPASVPSAFAQQNNAVVTSAIDTSAAVDIVFTGQLTSGAESVTLESYVVEVLYKA